MKSSLIIIFVLSLSLVGFISNSYAEFGTFVIEIDGTGTNDDGVGFVTPVGITVDNYDNIIITDNTLNSVHMVEYDGSFVTVFNGSKGGGQLFDKPIGVAVDSQDYRIIVTDVALDIIQIYGMDGNFITSFDGSGGHGTEFVTPYGVAVDSNGRIIVADSGLNFVQIFDEEGTFLTSIGDVIDDIEFGNPIGVAVDSNDRIIVADSGLNFVQIFEADGTFVLEFDGTEGGEAFMNPVAVAVDSEDRIIVIDTTIGLVQIYDSNGVFLDSFDGTDGGTELVVPIGVAVDSNDRILVIDITHDTVQIFEGFIEGEDIEDNTSQATELDESSDDANGGCNDCTPPTLGLDFKDQRIVDYGFSYNGNSVQVERWHTPFPLITAYVNQTNTVEVIVFENGGVYNMALVQFGLGASEIGQPLNDLEVLIEVWLDPYGNNGDEDAVGDIAIEKVIIKDRDNLIDTYSVFAVAHIVKCQADSYDEKCLKVTLQYSYREATINNIMVVNVSDKPRNSQNFFFNDGVEVVGESLNEPPTYTLHNKNLKQQTENLYLTLTRTDKVNHIWTDESGVEYLQVSTDRFDRLTPHTPIECTDPPLSEISVPTRQNCHFRELTHLWSD